MSHNAYSGIFLLTPFPTDIALVFNAVHTRQSVILSGRISYECCERATACQSTAVNLFNSQSIGTISNRASFSQTLKEWKMPESNIKCGRRML